MMETHRTCGENKTKNNGRDGSLYFVLTRNGMQVLIMVTTSDGSTE